MPKATETLLEIDLNALDNNYRYITSKLKHETKVLAVVKAFAYGSDSVAIAKELIDLGETLRNAKIETPILVLHPIPANFEVIINRCLEPSLYSRKTLEEFIAYAEAKNQSDYPIHLKFNIGLNRLGFVESDIPFILEGQAMTFILKKRPTLKKYYHNSPQILPNSLPCLPVFAIF